MKQTLEEIIEKDSYVPYTIDLPTEMLYSWTQYSQSRAKKFKKKITNFTSPKKERKKH